MVGGYNADGSGSTAARSFSILDPASGAPGVFTDTSNALPMAMYHQSVRAYRNRLYTIGGMVSGRSVYSAPLLRCSGKWQAILKKAKNIHRASGVRSLRNGSGWLHARQIHRKMILKDGFYSKMHFHNQEMVRNYHTNSKKYATKYYINQTGGLRCY